MTERIKLFFLIDKITPRLLCFVQVGMDWIIIERLHLSFIYIYTPRGYIHIPPFPSSLLLSAALQSLPESKA